MDKAKVYVKGGNGGNGCISFRREKYVPKGGPYGGNGGRGGDVVIQATESLNTLIELRRVQHYKAADGRHGKGKLMHGKDGAERIIKVPVGTILKNGNTKELIADLSSNGAKITVARGGDGGRGNAAFKSSTYQAPRVAEKGEPGEEKWVDLEIKILADVGLVGYPNVGKSSLLAKVSAAKPKIADYPFTTLSPNLGVVDLEMDKSFVLADIPGLIEGAHKGAGLGDDFLKHVERTKVLIHLLDPVSDRDPIKDYKEINLELGLYNPNLARLPQLIAVNKVDMQQSRPKVDEVSKFFYPTKVYPISAKNGEGTKELMYAAFELLKRSHKSALELKIDEGLRENLADDARFYYKPRFSISKKNDKFIVSGEEPKRAVLMSDLSDIESIQLLSKKLKRLGVLKALEKEGIKSGDVVIVDDYEFTFYKDGIAM